MDRARRLPLLVAAAPLVMVGSAFVACAPDHPEAGGSLRSAFPKHADEVLRADRTFEIASDGVRRAHASHAVDVALPARGDGEVVFTMARGDVIRVREIGASGPARAVEAAATYDRPGGASYWSLHPRGVEEWLDLQADAVVAGEPVATWSVAGGRFAEIHGVIAVIDDRGRAMLRVEAPHAYGTDGREIDVDLDLVGDRLALRVDADHERVLVDPLWSDAGDMTTPRSDHAATLLDDGRVMVAGGFNTGFGSTNTVEIYDPGANLWSSTDSLPLALTGHTMTLLPLGEPMVCGGFAGDPILFCYTWNGSVWGNADSMANSRSGHTATPLVDGTVFVFGGNFSSNGELYDPGTFTWSTTTGTSSLGGRSLHTATRLLDGRVLIAGGSVGNTTSTAEIYDPVSDTFTTTGSMLSAREQFAAALLPDGRVLATGGGTDYQAAEIFDPATDTWSAAAPMNVPRDRHTLTTLLDGTVVAIGGSPTSGTESANDGVEFYDPATDTWTNDTFMDFARVSHTATMLDDGNVLVAGGFVIGPTRLTSAERYLSVAPLLPNGSPCEGGGQCLSGFCTEEVCCDELCDGECETCTVAGGGETNGVCQGLDATPCVGGQCEAGVCVPDLLPNGDPCTVGSDCSSGTCFDDVCCEFACSNFGECWACSIAAGGTEDGTCTPAAGRDCNTFGDCSPDDICDAAGACVPVDEPCPITECLTDNFCGKGSCAPTFRPDDTPCSGGGACQDGICIPPVPLENGEPCVDGVQCESTQCADDVCCDSPCFGECSACSIAAGADEDGTCGPIADGTLCGKGTGTCQAGVCTFTQPDGSPCDIGEQCDSGFCADNRCCESACVGECVACSEAEGSSADGVCSPLEDGTTCSKGEGVCDGGSCIVDDLLADGEPCEVGRECGSTFCVDDVCCESSCVGECVACSEAEGSDADGQCTAVPDGTACTDGTCGNGLCVGDELGDLGDPCEDASACASDFCADGVCCNEACDGDCDACSTDEGAEMDGHCGNAAGRECDDGDACTQTDACEDRSCEGSNPVECAPGPCQVSSACSHDSGACVPVSLPDGAPCEGGICVAGSCITDPDVGNLSVGATGNAAGAGPGAGNGNGASVNGSGPGAASGSGAGAGSADDGDVDGAESDDGCTVSGDGRGAADLAWLVVAAAVGTRLRGARRVRERDGRRAAS